VTVLQAMVTSGSGPRLNAAMRRVPWNAYRGSTRQAVFRMAFDEGRRVRDIVAFYADGRGPTVRTIRRLIAQMQACGSHSLQTWHKYRADLGKGDELRRDSKMTEAAVNGVRTLLERNPSLYLDEVRDLLAAAPYAIKRCTQPRAALKCTIATRPCYAAQEAGR